MFIFFLLSTSFSSKCFTNATSCGGLAQGLWSQFCRLWRKSHLWWEAVGVTCCGSLGWAAGSVGMMWGWVMPTLPPLWSKVTLWDGHLSTSVTAEEGSPSKYLFPCEGVCTFGFHREHVKAKVLVFKMFLCFLRCSVSLLFFPWVGRNRWAQGLGCAGVSLASLPLLAVLQQGSIKITQTFWWKVCVFDVLIYFFGCLSWLVQYLYV